MNTPILTKKQQRQSLSAKKGPIKGLRNILAQPAENFWPTINMDNHPTLVTLMNEILPLMKQPRYKIPGFMLRHIPKEKRILVVKEELEKESAKFDRSILKFVILGINAITRALEKNNVCCVLLDANVEPLLIKHIVIMAQNKKIPVLLLPILKTITLQKIGFATAAFALKNNVIQSSDNVFHALYKLVVEIFKDIEPPKRSLQLFKPDEASEESATYDVESTSKDSDSTSKSKRSVVTFTDVYKYRSSRKERAFIPPTVKKSSQVSQAQSNEFIALSNDPDFADDENITTKTLKNARYVNICEEEESESESTEKCSDQSLNDSKLIDNSVNSSKRTKTSTLKKLKKIDVTYLPLKIKRMQGNNHREKATKFTKRKKKL